MPLSQRKAVQQPVAARNHHVAVRGDELGVPQQHLAARPDREGRGKAFRFRRQRREKRAAVPAFGAHLFVGKPAETEFLEIEQQGVGIQHPGVVLVDAENAPLEDEERRNMAVAHVDHRNALALAALATSGAASAPRTAAVAVPQARPCIAGGR